MEYLKKKQMLNKDNSNLNDLCKLYKVDKTKIETLIKKKLSKQNTVKPESKLKLVLIFLYRKDCKAFHLLILSYTYYD